VEDQALRRLLEDTLGIVVTSQRPIAEAARLDWIRDKLVPGVFDPRSPWDNSRHRSEGEAD
jgi:hypothetical protein